MLSERQFTRQKDVQSGSIETKMSGYTQAVFIAILIGSLLFANIYAESLGDSPGIILALLFVCAMAYGIYWMLSSPLPNDARDHDSLAKEFKKQVKSEHLVHQAAESVKTGELTCQDFVTLFPQDCLGPDSPIVKEGICDWNPEKAKCVSPLSGGRRSARPRSLY